MDDLLADHLRTTLPRLSLARVGAADGEALADIRVAAMRDSLQALGRFDAQRARSRFLDAFEPACTLALVWHGERVGLVVLRAQADHIHLDHLYVLPKAQSQGIGADVLRAVFALADIRGMPVRVGALKHSRSNGFYARHGFGLVESTEWDNHYVRAPAGR